jgi:hypothetical protein
MLRAFSRLGCAKKTPIGGRVPPKNCRSTTRGRWAPNAGHPHEPENAWTRSRRAFLGGTATREDVPHLRALAWLQAKGGPQTSQPRRCCSARRRSAHRAQAPWRSRARTGPRSGAAAGPFAPRGGEFEVGPSERASTSAGGPRLLQRPSRTTPTQDHAPCDCAKRSIGVSHPASPHACTSK